MHGPLEAPTESVGLKRKLPFLNVHNWLIMEVSSLTYIIEIPSLTNGTLQILLPPGFVFKKMAGKKGDVVTSPITVSTPPKKYIVGAPDDPVLRTSCVLSA